MGPAYLTAVAVRLHSKRVALALTSVTVFVVLLAFGHFMPQTAPILAPVAGPPVFFALGDLLCLHLVPSRAGLTAREAGWPSGHTCPRGDAVVRRIVRRNEHRLRACRLAHVRYPVAVRSNKSFDTDAQRRSFASLRSFPLVAGQLRR